MTRAIHRLLWSSMHSERLDRIRASQKVRSQGSYLCEQARYHEYGRPGDITIGRNKEVEHCRQLRVQSQAYLPRLNAVQEVLPYKLAACK